MNKLIFYKYHKMIIENNIIKEDKLFDNIKEMAELEKIQLYIPLYDSLFKEKNLNASLKDLNILSKIKSCERNKFDLEDNNSFFIKYQGILQKD